MRLIDFLDQYGYVAIVVGTFAEGETVLVLGGFAAHQGYLELPWVVLAAFAGSLCGDQCAFFAGRRYGTRILSRFSRWQPAVDRATTLLRRNETWLLIGFRFVYGIRNVTPFTAGLSAIPASRFVLLNMAGALLWSVCVAAAGYAFGRGFSSVLTRARHFEEHAAVAILVGGLLWLGLTALRRHRERRKA
jgi:membrane protein DedA with SNARE-associated domain